MATVVEGDFEWDDAKAESNMAKHGVSFEEASTVSSLEPRCASEFYTSFTSSVARDRIISARGATPAEREIYEDGGK